MWRSVLITKTAPLFSTRSCPAGERARARHTFYICFICLSYHKRKNMCQKCCAIGAACWVFNIFFWESVQSMLNAGCFFFVAWCFCSFCCIRIISLCLRNYKSELNAASSFWILSISCVCIVFFCGRYCCLRGGLCLFVADPCTLPMLACSDMCACPISFFCAFKVMFFLVSFAFYLLQQRKPG